MKKKRLLAEPSFDFILLALLADMREYKLAWLLNQLFRLRLVKEVDIKLQFTNAEELVISNYMYATEHSCVRLLLNRSLAGDAPRFLLPELRQFDYLLLLEGEGGAFDAQALEQALRKRSDIQYVNRVAVSSLQSKDNLIF
jgi:hypothetical protein